MPTSRKIPADIELPPGSGIDEDESPDEVPYSTRPSSPATLDRYESEYTFSTPSGTDFLCGWHISLSPNAWRIYFAPEYETKRLVIGYVGTHLPTVTKFT
jgi:hypothetical protein